MSVGYEPGGGGGGGGQADSGVLWGGFVVSEGFVLW